MAESDIFRGGKVHVLSEKCASCIFTTDRPVEGARVAQMVRDTKDEPGATVPCHSTMYRPGKKEHAICRGWFDRFAEADPILAMAQAQGVITYDPLPEDSVWAKPVARQPKVG
jgi:hypothetical protein